jgi:hypothetical protein
MKFLYVQAVKVVGGFYAGQRGMVVGYANTNTSYAVEMETLVHNCWRTITVDIEEDNLEAIK